MKPVLKPRFRLAALLLMPLALFFIIRERQSWRPRVLGQMKNGVSALAWSPDGKWLAGCEELYGQPASIYVWNMAQRRQKKRLPVSSTCSFLQFSADSRVLYGLDHTATLRRWSIADGRELQPSPVKIDREYFTLSADGSLVLTREKWGMTLRRVVDGQLQWVLPDKRDLPSAACFSSDSKKLAFLMQPSLKNGRSIRVWSLPPTGSPLRISRVPSYSGSLHFWPDDNTILQICSDGLFAYDFPSGNLKAHVANGQGGIDLMPSGRAFVQSGITAPYVWFREWPSGEEMRHISINASESGPLRISPDGYTLAVANAPNAGTITLWRVK